MPSQPDRRSWQPPGSGLRPTFEGAPWHHAKATASTVTASGENGPGEARDKLTDDTSMTRWLPFSATATITCQLSGATTVRQYTLTSADDLPGRVVLPARGLGCGERRVPVADRARHGGAGPRETDDADVDSFVFA